MSKISSFLCLSSLVFIFSFFSCINLFALEDMSTKGDANPFEKHDKKLAKLKDDLEEIKDDKNGKEARAKIKKQITACEKSKDELLKRLIEDCQRKIDAGKNVIANAEKVIEEGKKNNSDTSRQEKEKIAAKEMITKTEERISQLNSQAGGSGEKAQAKN